MFWRFGFHNGSAIDGLLDKEDVSLEAILDEDDLLQECKSQNTRLLDYLGRIDVLQKLLGYVTGQIEGDEKGRFKYPYVATEVLCSEIWSIVETCINEQNQLLLPFWEVVLDRSPDDMKTQMVMASHFAKVNAVFLNKKPAEMFAFIQSQPGVLERLLRHVETPSIVDLLVRVIQLDEQPGGLGVLEWLSSENLMGRLLELLSPQHSGDIHTDVADLIKGIVSMATPSPGSSLTDGLQNGTASNRFARELARRESIEKLVSYILHDYRVPEKESTSVGESNPPSSTDSPMPTLESSTSSVVHSISIIIELIRKNNSDFFEPHLFHTLRNRLIQVQQEMHANSGDSREVLEQAMKEIVDRIGVVHLGPLLEVMCQHLEELQQLLKTPRSLHGRIETTVGSIVPLTLERYRICELFAELLHCSNMSLLNRPAAYNRLYDSEGRLQGSLSALEELAQVVASNAGLDRSQTIDESQDEVEPALELPVTNVAHGSSSIDSDDDMIDDDDEPGSSDDDAMEDIAMYDEPQSQLDVTGPPSTSENLPTEESAKSPSVAQSPDSDKLSNRLHGSRRSSHRTGLDTSTDSLLPVGKQLKRKYLELNILSTLLDLFFEFPWNNFLHGAVYDFLHQVLTGNMDGALDRELVISLFRDALLMHRIVEGQQRNDSESVRPKGSRLGYMGHLTNISEDVVTAIERYPADLRVIISQYAPEPEWNRYVTGRYNETKSRDARLLGGGKPVLDVASSRNAKSWNTDGEDLTSDTGKELGSGAVRGEFRRAMSVGPTRENSADFGPALIDEEDDDDSSNRAPHFARYLAQEMNSSDHFGSSSDDEDEDEGGWLSHSTFSLSNPPVSTRHQFGERRPLSANTFDDSFGAGAEGASETMHDDPFNPRDDDGFGPFSDPAVASGNDPFTFPSSFSDEMEDSSFESFGDFGDFQNAEDGELTPTAGSWTFASGSTTESASEETHQEAADKSPFS